jgi:hypothetical protein
MINEAVERFNDAATDLQATEFHHAKTPDEWQRMAQNRAAGNYAALIGAVVPLIEAFGAASLAERASVGSKLTPSALGILRRFAGAVPALAVRRQSPELIAQGLTALAILGSVDDVRDLTFYLATMHYSAIKLEIDARKVFADAASLVPSTGLQNEMRGFPLRAPKDRDLAALGLRETRTKEGFDLVQDLTRGL